MHRSFDRTRAATLGLMVAMAGAACSAAPQAEAGEPGAITSEAAREVMQHPDPDVLKTLTELDPKTYLGSEKIRHGALIDSSAGVGNAAVLIGVSVPAGTESCTAQVINRFFLLTAGHCIEKMLPSGAGELFVDFTDGLGVVREVYAGPVIAGMAPDWRRRDRDIGLIMLRNGMATCQNSRGVCASTQPGVPENAFFQFYVPGSAPTPQASYTVVGYGGIDDQRTDAGVLRRSSMPTASAVFNDSTSFEFIMGWSLEPHPRVCLVDSGGPLVPMVGDRILYTGITSVGIGGGCSRSSGAVAYTGVSLHYASWLLSTILSLRNFFGLSFDCAATTSSPALFACDNDGSVF